MYSAFGEDGNPSALKDSDLESKPLVESLKEQNMSMPRIVPVVKTKEKMYDMDIDEVDEYTDVANRSLAEIRMTETELVNLYNSSEIPDGQNKYRYLINNLNQAFKPYELAELTNNVIEVNTNINAIVNNLGEFFSSIACDDKISRKQFLLKRFTTSLTQLHIKNEKDIELSTYRTKIAENDTIDLDSVLMLPHYAIEYSKLVLPASSILTKSNLNFRPKFYLIVFKKK